MTTGRPRFRRARLATPRTPRDAADDGSQGAWPTETSGLLANAGQDVFFPLGRDLADVTVEQICGPEQVIPYPQAEDFAARFTTAGWYRFVLKNPEGELQQTGVYGESVANPYTILAGR